MKVLSVAIFLGIVGSIPCGASEIQIPDEYLNLRDPFHPFEIKQEIQKPKSPLEGFPVESFTMTGMMTGPDKVKAMLTLPDGTSYFVTEKMKIGLHNGIIQRITTDKVVVRERGVNAIGQDESYDTEIIMAPLVKPGGSEKEKGLPGSSVTPSEVAPTVSN